MREEDSSGRAASEKPTGRSLVDFSGAYKGTPNGLYPAEEDLLIHAKDGSVYVVDKRRPCASLPEGGSDSKERPNFIRSAFIRFLALGGDGTHPVHEKGVQVEGAWIGYPPVRDDDLDATLTTNNIDLESCNGVGQIVLQRCHIDGDIILRDAHTRTVDLQGSYVAGGIEARRACIEGSLYLRYKKQDAGTVRDVFEAENGMDLVDADIRGSLECHEAIFGHRKGKPPNEDGTAIFGSRANIRGGVFLHQGFLANGPIVFRGASIGGNFECSGGRFKKVEYAAAPDRNKRAIDCQGAKIGGSVYFRPREWVGDERTPVDRNESQNFIAFGEICFIDTEISGSFECHCASIHNANGNALLCSRMKVAGTVFLHQGFSAEGRVAFRRATIGGNLECDGGKFENKRGDGKKFTRRSIDCQGITTGGSVYFRPCEKTGNNFSAEGEICFIDAQISGSFECHRARIKASDTPNSDALALLCSRMRVGGSVFLHKNFEAKGEVGFRRANVGGNFDASHATIRGKGGKALSCEGMHVTGSVLLGSPPSTHGEPLPNEQKRHFKAFGAVDFSGAIVDGDFDCEGGHFINARPKEMNTPPKKGDAIRCDEALKLRRTVIRGALKFGKAPGSGRHPVCWGTLDLRDARIAVLVDDAEAWKIETIREGSCPEEPKKQTNELRCYVLLDGFTYDQIGGDSPLDAKNRRKWLGRELEFKPQPYEQLIKVLRAMGESSEAVQIAIERERRDPPKKLLSRLLWRAWSIIGYGYLWSRVFYLSIVIWFVCGVAYSAMNSSGWVRYSAATMDYTLFEKCSAAQDKLIAARRKRDSPVTDNDLKTVTKLLQIECPQFNAFKLSADAILPIMGLGEKKHWTFKVPEEIDNIVMPIPGGGVIGIPRYRFTLSELLDMLFTLEMLFGWVFGVSLGIVLSQKINRE